MKSYKKLFIVIGIIASMQACAAPNPAKTLNIVDKQEFTKWLDDLDMTNEFYKGRQQIAKQGYQSTATNEPSDLRATVAHQLFDKRHYMQNSRTEILRSEDDTYMRPSSSQIHLMFNYPGVDKALNVKVVGAAPAGQYVDGKWSGIGEYFGSEELGNCHLTIFDMKDVKGAVILPSDAIEYTVNNKPTLKTVEGNIKDGFVYSVNWFDDTFNHEIRCALRKFGSSHIEKLVVAANEIDPLIIPIEAKN